MACCSWPPSGLLWSRSFEAWWLARRRTLLGLSQYVRPAGLVIVPAFMLLPFLLDLPRRRAAVAALSRSSPSVFVLAPSVAWQYQRYGRVSLSTSNFDGWSLLVGLNLNSLGQYNREESGTW